MSHKWLAQVSWEPSAKRPVTLKVVVPSATKRRTRSEPEPFGKPGSGLPIVAVVIVTRSVLEDRGVPAAITTA